MLYANPTGGIPLLPALSGLQVGKGSKHSTTRDSLTQRTTGRTPFNVSHRAREPPSQATPPCARCRMDQTHTHTVTHTHTHTGTHTGRRPGRPPASDREARRGPTLAGHVALGALALRLQVGVATPIEPGPSRQGFVTGPPDRDSLGAASGAGGR